jgi:hypothetical protein
VPVPAGSTMAHAGQGLPLQSAISHTAGRDAPHEASVSAGRRPAVAALGVAMGGEGTSSCAVERARRLQGPAAFAHCKRPAVAGKGHTLCSRLVALAGVHLVAVATLVQPALALSGSALSSSAGPVPYPPLLPLGAASMGAPECGAGQMLGTTGKELLRDPAMMLHLRGGEEPKTPGGASRKRSFAESAKTPAAPMAGKNNNHKRPASATTIARAKEAATRLYKQGSELVPSMDEVRKLPASAAHRLRKVPAALREQKRKFDAIPREVKIKRMLLPAVGMSSVVGVACALHMMGHGATLVLMCQAQLERLRALGAEAWEVPCP